MRHDRVEALLQAELHSNRLHGEVLTELRKLREEMAYHRKLEHFETLMSDDEENMLVHYSDYMPCSIAPAQLIKSRLFGDYRRADSCTWRPGMGYKTVHDEDGVQCCSGKGLEHWAKYVATDLDGYAYQYSYKPVWDSESREWIADPLYGLNMAVPEDDIYRKNVPASESLMRVWRDE